MRSRSRDAPPASLEGPEDISAALNVEETVIAHRLRSAKGAVQKRRRGHSVRSLLLAGYG